MPAHNFNHASILWGLVATAVAAAYALPSSPMTSRRDFPKKNISSVDNDCSLNGDLRNGRCVCDPAWEGPDCELLRLLPANPEAGLQLHRQHPNNNGLYSSWGGSVLKRSRLHCPLCAYSYSHQTNVK